MPRLLRRIGFCLLAIMGLALARVTWAQPAIGPFESERMADPKTQGNRTSNKQGRTQPVQGPIFAADKDVLAVPTVPPSWGKPAGKGSKFRLPERAVGGVDSAPKKEKTLPVPAKPQPIPLPPEIHTSIAADEGPEIQVEPKKPEEPKANFIPLPPTMPRHPVVEWMKENPDYQGLPAALPNAKGRPKGPRITQGTIQFDEEPRLDPAMNNHVEEVAKLPAVPPAPPAKGPPVAKAPAPPATGKVSEPIIKIPEVPDLTKVVPTESSRDASPAKTPQPLPILLSKKPALAKAPEKQSIPTFQAREIARIHDAHASPLQSINANEARLEKKVRRACGNQARDVRVLPQGDGSVRVRVTACHVVIGKALLEKLEDLPELTATHVSLEVYIDGNP